jgi:hypothetical protein
VIPSARDIVPIMIATSFAAGLNVYATVATLGLLARAEVVQLPASLHLIESWYVIIPALALFLIEFVADKIPAFDLVWNALHTFVRVPVAALITYQATAYMSPSSQIMTTVAAGFIALAAHGGKTAVRAAVTPSPEPFSNMTLSLGEDVLAVGLTWFATQHPWVTAGIVIVLVALTIVLVRWIVRALRRLFRGAERELAGTSAAT